MFWYHYQTSKLIEKMSKEITCKYFNAVMQVMISKCKRKDVLMLAFNSQRVLSFALF